MVRPPDTTDPHEDLRSLSLELRKLELQRAGLHAERDALRRQVARLRTEIEDLRQREGLRGTTRRLRRSLGALVGSPPAGDAGAAAEPEPAAPGKAPGSRPAIAVLVDTIDWSFANIARQMEACLGDEFDIEIISTIELNDDPVLALYLARHHDLIHFMWRESVFEARAYFAKSIDLYFGSIEQMNSQLSGKTTFTVYDHLFTGPEDVPMRLAMFNDYAIAYAVCSKKLQAIYQAIPEFPEPAALVQDGVDLKVFRPANLGRLGEAAGRALRIGWVGNSRWATDVRSDSKGFHTILEPAVEQALADGRQIERVYADRQVRFIAHSAMPQFYSTIDVLICTSEIEGTPNPVLEAMACGVPIITTDVGIVPEAFGPLQREFILPERSVACLTQAIERLCDEPALLLGLSEENLAQVRDWDWATRIESYRAFFRRSLAEASARAPAAS